METNQASNPGRPQAAGPQPQAAGREQNTNEPPLRDAIEQAVDSVGTLYRQAEATIQQQAETSPYVTLATAAAVGFVIGGGLASPLGQRLLRLTLRQFGPPLLSAVLDASKGVERASSTAADV
jgi:hypothetical protein